MGSQEPSHQWGTRYDCFVSGCSEPTSCQLWPAPPPRPWVPFLGLWLAPPVAYPPCCPVGGGPLVIGCGSSFLPEVEVAFQVLDPGIFSLQLQDVAWQPIQAQVPPPSATRPWSVDTCPWDS